MCKDFVCSGLVSAAVPQQEGWRAVEACFKLKIAITQSCDVESKCSCQNRMDLPLLKDSGEGFVL